MVAARLAQVCGLAFYVAFASHKAATIKQATRMLLPWETQALDSLKRHLQDIVIFSLNNQI